MTGHETSEKSEQVDQINRVERTSENTREDSVISGDRIQHQKIHQEASKQGHNFDTISGKDNDDEMLGQKPCETEEQHQARLKRLSQEEKGKSSKSKVAPLILEDSKTGEVFYDARSRSKSGKEEEKTGNIEIDKKQIGLNSGDSGEGNNSGVGGMEGSEKQPLIAYEATSENRSKLFELPKSEKAWQVEIDDFLSSLKKGLGRYPVKSDYAKIIMSPGSEPKEVLNASILYAYDLKPNREESRAMFAQTYGSDMFERSKAHKLFPEELANIDYDKIQQNFPDSCPFMAAIIEMTRSDGGRSKLRQMIRENTNGSYLVTFPGDEANPVLVNGITGGEKMIGSSSSQGYLFPAILEKAYGKYLNDRKLPGERTDITCEGAKHAYNDFELGMKLLTGRKVETISTLKAGNITTTYDMPFYRALVKAKAEGTIAIAGIKSPPNDKELKVILHGNHAFVVEQFNEDTVTLRDPLPVQNRVTRPFTWDEFNKIFNILIIEKRSRL